MDVTHDAALGGRLRLTQPKRGHRFGHDAILLAAAVPAKRGDRVVEFGAGVGAAGLAVAARVPGIDLTLIEIEPELTSLASANISANGFASARAMTLDVTEISAFDAAGLAPGSADHVLANPPFNDETLQQSPDPLRRVAHAAGRDTLPRWIASAAHLLKPHGTFTLIWRWANWPDAENALARIFGAIVALPIVAVDGERPIRVIARATNGAGGTSKILDGFALNDRDRRPTAAAEAVLRGGSPLPI